MAGPRACDPAKGRSTAEVIRPQARPPLAFFGATRALIRKRPKGAAGRFPLCRALARAAVAGTRGFPEPKDAAAPKRRRALCSVAFGHGALARDASRAISLGGQARLAIGFETAGPGTREAALVLAREIVHPGEPRLALCYALL